MLISAHAVAVVVLLLGLVALAWCSRVPVVGPALAAMVLVGVAAGIAATVLVGNLV